MSAEPDPGALFDGIVRYEAACQAGQYERVLAGASGQPLGLAWAPRGLDALPAGLGPRAVELEGPGGSRLLYVPFTLLGQVLTAGAQRLGVDPEQEPRFRVLGSLQPGAEVAVHGLFDLLGWLCAQASGRPRATEHRVDFAAQAQLQALLMPGRDGRTPVVMSEEREPHTGFEVRTLVVDVGGRPEVHRYTGGVFTGVGLEALRAERERLSRVEEALERYRAELEAVIGFLSGERR
jgi:hypothetical protein